MARLGLRITDEMEEALGREAAKTRIPLSELVRMAIEDMLKQRGYELTETVERGGWRGGAKDKRQENN
jgi:hypothetical protein